MLTCVIRCSNRNIESHKNAIQNLYLLSGTKGKNHVENITSGNPGDFDGSLIVKVLASEKDSLLLDRDTLTLHEFLLDSSNGHVWLDIDLMFPSGDSVNLNKHVPSDLT